MIFQYFSCFFFSNLYVDLYYANLAVRLKTAVEFGVDGHVAERPCQTPPKNRQSRTEKLPSASAAS